MLACYGTSARASKPRGGKSSGRSISRNSTSTTAATTIAQARTAPQQHKSACSKGTASMQQACSKHVAVGQGSHIASVAGSSTAFKTSPRDAASVPSMISPTGDTTAVERVSAKHWGTTRTVDVLLLCCKATSVAMVGAAAGPLACKNQLGGPLRTYYRRQPVRAAHTR